MGRPDSRARSDERDPARPLGSRRQRGTELARLSASTGAGYVASRVRGFRGDELASHDFHAATAQRAVELLGSMKGAAMKLGQIVSFVDLDLPEDIKGTYHEVLAGLRHAAPPVDPEAIAGVVADEFGARPEEVFASWDPEPLASASIGQVHRATLPDGRRVVAKVQYPGVAEAVEADLSNVEALAPVVRMLSPNLQVRPLMEELRARLADELDYQREAQYQHAFAERYEGHPYVRIPAVHFDWCRPRVLVCDEMHGASFEDLANEGDQGQREHHGEVIYRFVYGSLHMFRLFNADPHPGNYLFPGDGTVVFLDFGSVKLFPTAVRAALQEILQAVVAGDQARLARVMDEAGFVPAGHAPDWERLMTWFRRFHRPMIYDEPFTYTPEFATEVIRSTTDPRYGPIDVLRKLNLPADYLLLNRIQWGVNSILGRLRARANWHRISREWWDGAEPASEIGRREAEFLAGHPQRA